MNGNRYSQKLFLLIAVLLLGPAAVFAQVNIQCPTDPPGGALVDRNGDGILRADTIVDGVSEIENALSSNLVCMHLGAGDGFLSMADRESYDPGNPGVHDMYMFGFSNLTGINAEDAVTSGTLAATFPAPPIVLKEGDEFYLSLTNVGMMMRPDLFDPHTVHWHGFPEAASIFDGVPDASISINMGSTLTYYYKVVKPGTYMYHCHVEATEHMQMGMLGNLYVTSAQDGTSLIHNGKTYTKFAYNDGDGSTGYDLDYPIQIGSFDSAFHDASVSTQPLPFATMRDDYPMLNGRGYPDTVNAAPQAPLDANPIGAVTTQPESSLIEAAPGQRILLRISDLNVTRFYTLQSQGIDMQVIGRDARLLRGPSPDGGITPGKNLYYRSNSVTVGGGESYDVIIEIPDSAATGDTYFLHAGELNYLSNGAEEYGGMMTEIRVVPAAG